MRYASMEEMIRNISDQIFRSKDNKAVFVTALDNTTDSIRITELTGKKKNAEASLDDIFPVCPPLGFMNTKDKELVLLERQPRRQYKIGLCSSNTSCKSFDKNANLHPVDTIKRSAHLYERMVIGNQYPSLEEAVAMLSSGFKNVALSRVLALSNDEEYGRLVIFNKMNNVLASKSTKSSTWTKHVEGECLSNLGV